MDWNRNRCRNYLDPYVLLHREKNLGKQWLALMSWKMFIVIEHEPGRFYDSKNRYLGKERDLPIGACWVGHESKTWGVKLPGIQGLNRFCPTLEYNHSRWRVRGEWPNITVEPGIHCIGEFFGMIENGTISDDADSKQYTKRGELEVRSH